MTTRPPVVQARARATRTKILTQAERAFAERGFDATSLTSDILEPAGVSVGSFYHQFENKRDVLFTLLDERLHLRRAAAMRFVSDPDMASFGEILVHAMHALFDDMDERPDPWRIQYRELQNPDPEIGQAINLGWRAWADTGRALVTRWHEGSAERVDAAARLTILVSIGLLRDYLIADDEERRAIRHDLLPAAAEFCAAGTERLLDGVAERPGRSARDEPIRR